MIVGRADHIEWKHRPVKSHCIRPAAPVLHVAFQRTGSTRTWSVGKGKLWHCGEACLWERESTGHAEGASYGLPGC